MIDCLIFSIITAAMFWPIVGAVWNTWFPREKGDAPWS